MGPSPLIECSIRCLGWLNLLLIRLGIQGCISRSNTPRPFRRFVNHMNVSFFPFASSCLLHLLFYHRVQSFRVNYILAPNTLINVLPNRNQACEVSDLGTDHLLIVRRLKVINESLDHLVFHHRRKHLGG